MQNKTINIFLVNIKLTKMLQHPMSQDSVLQLVGRVSSVNKRFA